MIQTETQKKWLHQKQKSNQMNFLKWILHQSDDKFQLSKKKILKYFEKIKIEKLIDEQV